MNIELPEDIGHANIANIVLLGQLDHGLLREQGGGSNPLSPTINCLICAINLHRNLDLTVRSTRASLCVLALL